ncbi:two-component sensor histidine kinase [Pedobacter psychrophilus]|uniref:histidine kinase n=1 Tax=Pedobacter psychrophilus TaxID=1826909 RepID=A0A179DES1_9SPHI|nr:HAMP domain-containing sensor histidine kinase [Pedobacter psychrophilus]OAQ39200.1 two-component sensor histidine kinase [Pedobacter psychrophilus]
MKIQTKISLLFICLSAGILILFNIFILYFEYQFNFRDFYDRLETRVNLSAQIKLNDDPKNTVYAEIRKEYLEKLEEEREFIVAENAAGKFINPNLRPKFIEEIESIGYSRFRKDNEFFYGKIFTEKGKRFLIAYSALNPYGLKEIDELQKILLFGFIGSILISFFVGKKFSQYTFAPFRDITQKVNSITSNNLHLRLEEPEGKDEIAELSLTFNNMLNRLEAAFETQNNFVSNASHELRTPLTIINSEIEHVLLKSDVNETNLKSLNLIHSETEKLIQIINSLLLLAQSGFNGKKQNWLEIRIDELILVAIESVKKVNDKANINIDFLMLPEDEKRLIVLGNHNLLRLAISNIISNACKYSQNKLVVVKLGFTDQNITISVIDKGIGIPNNEVQRIFEPFYRASNTEDFSGHGVGLPLTLNIIRLHRGSIGILSQENEGTQINVMLPIQQLN